MNFACPNSGYIAGIRSQHSDEREDRVFRFKCCAVPGIIVTMFIVVSKLTFVSVFNKWNMEQGVRLETTVNIAAVII